MKTCINYFKVLFSQLKQAKEKIRSSKIEQKQLIGENTNVSNHYNQIQVNIQCDRVFYQTDT